MPIELNFYPLDAVVAGENVIVFGYTQDKKRVAVIDNRYFPWFSLSTGKVNELKAVCEKESIQQKHLQAEGDSTKAFFNVRDFDTIARAARNIDTLYNSDIPLRKRWWVDKKITPFNLTKVIGEISNQQNLKCDVVIVAEFIDSLNSPIKDVQILGFDLETASENSFPNPANDPIISAALYQDDFKKVITWKHFKDAPDYVRFVESEAELIEELVRNIKELKPHVLVGYGSDNFDMPFLIERAQKYNISLDFGWDDSSISMKKKGHKTARIIGISYCDISHFMRRIMDLDTDHYSLDLVAKKLLGKGKLAAVNAKKINEIWSVGLAEELALLANYNLVDAQLTQELAKKILPIHVELCKLTGQALHDVNLATYGTLVEWFIIKNGEVPIHPRPGSREVFERSKKSYVGGLVVEPTPGLYKDICAVDFRSLYPSIIVSHNISPETINCSCCGVKGKFEVREDSVWFCSKKQGLVPRLISNLIDRRKRINEILAQTNPNDGAFPELMARQHALKYVAAAFYGYLGFSASRFYSYDCAKAVTSLGRKYIQLVIKEAGKFGFKILYGDTDGLFVQLKENTDAEIKNFLQIINSVLPQPIELEFRANYKSGLFMEKKSGVGGGAKKRYALLTAGNSLILRGLEAIRGDWSDLAKKTQREVLRIILSEQNVEKAAELIKEKIKQVGERKVSLADLVINVNLTRPLASYATNSPHVVAARKAKEKGYPVQKGFLVRYIRTNGPEKVKLAEDATLEDYDIDYYTEHQLLRATYKIFELFGYGVEKLKGGQATLEGYGT